jgi:cystathionine beta-lyase/cystathionine gamma-synthase
LAKSNTGGKAFDTRLVHAGEGPDPATGAHGVPLYQNSTFAFRSYDQVMAFERGELPHFVYQRYGTPTVRVLELKMADLEGAELCASAATGMAAVTATLQELLRGGGGHVVAATDLYQVTHEILDKDVGCWGGSVTRAPIGDLDAVRAAMTAQTRLILAETLSNPHLEVADIEALAEIARAHDAVLVVDNTFLSPALYRPLEHGADLVIHSATKYLAGSGQMMGGFVSGRQALVGPIQARLARQGAGMQPFGAWQILAGIKTLSLRMERHSSTAARLAALCDGHPKVDKVYSPSNPEHPGQDVARRLFGDRFGGLFSLRFKAGNAAAKAFVDTLQIATIAVSLGEPTTLVWPYADGLVRVAVGLEDPGDLDEDFMQALEGNGA